MAGVNIKVNVEVDIREKKNLSMLRERYTYSYALATYLYSAIIMLCMISRCDYASQQQPSQWPQDQQKGKDWSKCKYK